MTFQLLRTRAVEGPRIEVEASHEGQLPGPQTLSRWLLDKRRAIGAEGSRIERGATMLPDCILEHGSKLGRQ